MATYRQLDSSITHARARLEIHKLCDLGFLEKKGQGRNTYYIRTSKLVTLVERLRPQDERLRPQHGTLGERAPTSAIPPPICRKTRPTARRLPMRERRKATESSWFIAWSMLFPTSSVCVCSCAILKGKRTRKLLA